MNKSVKWSMLLVMFILPQLVTAQCGVQLKVENYIFTGAQVNFTSSNSTLDPNWVIYSHAWWLNGVSYGGGNDKYLPLLDRYNLVRYEAKATNTISNDSCVIEYANVYYSTGRQVFNGADVFVSGYDVSVSGNVWSYLGNGQINNVVTWGDGSFPTPGQFGMHTYINPGTYQIWLYSEDQLDPQNQSFSFVDVHVPSGPDHLAGSMVINQGSCTNTLNNWVHATPSPTAGSYTYFGVDDAPVRQIGNSTPVNFTDTIKVPGNHVISWQMTDPNSVNGFDVTGFEPVLFQGCSSIPDTVRGIVWYDADGDAIMDSTELPAVSIPVRISNYSVLSDSSGNYEILMPQANVNVRITGMNLSVPLDGKYALTTNTAQVHEPLNFGIFNPDATVMGTVFLDYNLDSIFNTGDTKLENVLVSARNQSTNQTYSVQTNSDGNYTLELQSGNYVIKAYPINVDSVMTIPDSLVLTLTTGNYGGNSFAVSSTASLYNHCLNFIQGNIPRPGFSTSLIATVKQLSIDTASSTLVIYYDTALTYVSSSSGGFHDANAGTVTWDIPASGAGSNSIHNINLYVPISLGLGYPLQHQASVLLDSGKTDYNPLNNNRTINAVTIGAYDPNDKLVNPSEITVIPGSPNQDEFTYLINFQNVGTAEAINVTIVDVMDPLLDINSIQIINTSHTYELLIIDRTVTWKFLNINLPDSNSNEVQSHGYILYSIKPAANYISGTEIKNFADIYFDFNTPVRTNTATTIYKGCTTSISYSKLNVSCNALENGTINSFVSGSFPPYLYLWSNGNTGSALSALAGGTYVLTVTDAQSCEKQIQVNIFEPDPISAFTITNHPGAGDINLLVTGGIAPYNYNWSTGATTEDVTGLPPGFYWVTVTDRNGCAKIATVNLF